MQDALPSRLVDALLNASSEESLLDLLNEAWEAIVLAPRRRNACGRRT